MSENTYKNYGKIISTNFKVRCEKCGDRLSEFDLGKECGGCETLGHIYEDMMGLSAELDEHRLAIKLIQDKLALMAAEQRTLQDQQKKRLLRHAERLDRELRPD